MRLIFALNIERKDMSAQSTILLSFIMCSLKPRCPLTEQRRERMKEREKINFLKGVIILLWKQANNPFLSMGRHLDILGAVLLYSEIFS